jgi:hypothetical protein
MVAAKRKASKSEIEAASGKQLPIEHVLPDDQRTLFANHVTIQHTNEGEFLLSFFEIEQPLLLADAGNLEKQLANITSVKAVCRARVVMAAARMRKLIGALITNYETYERDVALLPANDTESQKHAS